MLIYDIRPPRAKVVARGQKKNIHPTKPKKILAIFTILFLILQFFAGLGFLYPKQAKAAGTTYYVDNCDVTGNDTNNGTSVSTPWLTINKVNTSSFVAGDTISFRKGCTWREQLTVPSSGSALGGNITFGAYGATGANPIINGAALLTTSGYTLYAASDTEIYTANAGSDADDGATRNLRSMITAAQISSSATSVKIRVYAASGITDLFINGSGIGPYAGSGDAYDASAMTRITWDGGSDTTTIAHGSYKDSDAITYTLNNAVNQVITLYLAARHYKGSGGTNTLYYNSTASDQSQTADVNSYSSAANNGFVRKIYSVGATYSYTYYAAQATDPGWVWEGGTPLKKVTTIATVESTAGSFYWDSTNLYLHASDGSNIASNGKTYEVYGRDYCITTNAKNYLTIDGIDCRNTAGTDSTLGGIIVTGTDTTVKNLISKNHRRHAFSCYTGATTGCTGDNLTLYGSFTTTLVSIYDTANGATLKNSDISNGTYYGPTNGFGCIVIHGGVDNTTIEHNSIHDCADGTNNGDGINAYDSGTTNIITRYNKFYGSLTRAVYASANTGLEVYYNLFYPTNSSALILLSGTTGSHIYNNSAYSTATQFAVSQTSASTGTLVKNNVFNTGKYVSVSTDSETSTVYSNNVYYGGSATPFTWGASNYSFANWKTNSSQDGTNSAETDPLFVSTVTPDFHLQAGSPAIDAGTNVNLTSDYAGTVVPQGGGYDISAYEYTQGTTPTVSLNAPAVGTVSGSTVTVSATASAVSPASIFSVQFKLNNAVLQSADTIFPYSIIWDTTSASNASHTLLAVATDNYGNVATSSPVTVTVDNAAPVRSGGSPSGSQTAGTTQITLSLTTDENATCKYSTTAGTAYGSMTGFSTTGETSHSSTISGLSNGQSYSYYIRCQDSSSNANSDDYTISFSVASPASGGGGGCVGCWVPPTVPTGGFKIAINQNASTTSNRIVALNFNAGTNIKKMAISMTGDFADSSQEDYQATKQWDLCSKLGGLIKNPICPNGKYTIYTKFYTAYGVTSDVAIASSSITLTAGATTAQSSQQNQSQKPFTKYLSYLDQNADVKRLQIFLNQDSDTRLANSGPGSLGKETNLFGRLTLKAVIKFQEKYAKDILTPWKLTKGTGFVGKTTMIKINELISKIIGR